MHDRKNFRGTYPAFALDHIEPMRPVVDRAILELIDTVTFTGEVTGKRAEDGKNIVECRVKGNNQRGDLVCLADATLVLPE